MSIGWLPILMAATRRLGRKVAAAIRWKHWPDILISAALVVAIWAVYWPVYQFEFTNYDDLGYVSENGRIHAGLTWENIKWAFSAEEESNWHPLTWLSYMLDCDLYGPHARSPNLETTAAGFWRYVYEVILFVPNKVLVLTGRPVISTMPTVSGCHHMINLVLHAGSTLLLFFALKRMTASTWPSVFVAALFAVHPLHVESVAWVAERKDVLSTFFEMGALLAYAFYVQRPAVLKYLWVLVLFALGLMSKPMVVTFPFVLLLLDYWPLGRIRIGAQEPVRKSGRQMSRENGRKKGAAPARLARATPWQARTPEGDFALLPWNTVVVVLEKLPLIALSVASCVETYKVQQASGAMKFLESIPFAGRLLNAMLAYVLYLWKAFVPVDLAVLYPFQKDYASLAWPGISAGAALIVATALVVWLGRRRRYLPVGWFWYLGTLVPVIGLVTVGAQSMADRYTYVPIIGIFMIVAWGALDLAGLGRGVLWIAVAGTAAGAIALVAWAACERQWQLPWQYGDGAGPWWDYRIVLAILVVVGMAAVVAVSRCREARWWLLGPAATIVLGCTVLTAGQVMYFKNSEALFRRAIEVTEVNAVAHNNLGVALPTGSADAEATRHFRRALEIEPDYAEAHNNLAARLASTPMLEEAIEHLRRAIQIRPNYVAAHYNLGLMMVQRQNWKDAVKEFQEALRYDPNYGPARNNLAIALDALGKAGEALGQAREAVRLNPYLPQAHENLANVLAKRGELPEAERELREVIRLTPDNPDAHYKLAMLLMQADKPGEAVSEFRESIRLKPDAPQPHTTLGILLAQFRRFDEAIAEFRTVLKLAPDAAEAHGNLGRALLEVGRTDEAIAEYREALRIQPDLAKTLSNLARILAMHADSKHRDGPEAVRLAERACRATNRQDPTCLGSLAAAYAEVGRFKDALAALEQAIAISERIGQKALADQLRLRLDSYKAERPFYDQPISQPAPT